MIQGLVFEKWGLSFGFSDNSLKFSIQNLDLDLEFIYEFMDYIWFQGLLIRVQGLVIIVQDLLFRCLWIWDQIYYLGIMIQLNFLYYLNDMEYNSQI